MNLILNTVKTQCYINSLYAIVCVGVMHEDRNDHRALLHAPGKVLLLTKKKSLQNNDTRVHGWKRRGVCSRVTGGALHTWIYAKQHVTRK